jgi:hypothetical protein
VLDVLTGKRDLVGDSTRGIGVEDAESTSASEYTDRVRWLYAGRVKLLGRWYRPCGVVTRFDANDAQFASKFATAWKPNKDATTEWGRRRAEFYAGPDGLARLVRCEVDGVIASWGVVFEPCSEPPHWLTPAIADQAAVDAWLGAGRGLAQLGAEVRPLDEAERMIVERELDDPEADALREIAAAAEDEQFAEELLQIGEKVRAQAGDDVIPLTLLDGRIVQVPRAPFTIWALDRTPEMRETLAAIKWIPVSPSGIKMCNDSTHHTDWVLGADLTIAQSYEPNVNEAAWALASEMQFAAVDRA